MDFLVANVWLFGKIATYRAMSLCKKLHSDMAEMRSYYSHYGPGPTLLQAGLV